VVSPQISFPNRAVVGPGILATGSTGSPALDIQGASAPAGTGGGIGITPGYGSSQSTAGNVLFNYWDAPNTATEIGFRLNGNNGSWEAVNGNIQMDATTQIQLQSGSTISMQPGSLGNVPSCHRYTLTALTGNWNVAVDGGTPVVTAMASASTQAVNLLALTGTEAITGWDIHTTTRYSDSSLSITTLGLTLGDSGGTTTSYASSSFGLFAAVGPTNLSAGGGFQHATYNASNVTANLTTSGANLNATLAGVVDIRLCMVRIP
jgi:hypothetical protein